MKPIKPVGGLAKGTIVMLCIYIFFAACLILSNAYQLIEFVQFDPDEKLTQLLPSQAILALVLVVFALVYIITAGFFLKWVYRVSKNLHLKTGTRWDHSAGGAVWWYFVPIATLFKPYQAMKEIWAKAHKQKWEQGSKLLPGWWALWLVATISSNISQRLPVETISECRVESIFSIVLNFFLIALALTAIALVSNVTQAYEKNFEQAEEKNETDEPESDYQQNLQSLTEPVT